MYEVIFKKDFVSTQLDAIPMIRFRTTGLIQTNLRGLRQATLTSMYIPNTPARNHLKSVQWLSSGEKRPIPSARIGEEPGRRISSLRMLGVKMIKSSEVFTELVSCPCTGKTC